MKKVLSNVLPFILIFSSCTKLDTKLIASKYYRGVVKIILMDPELERINPGKGYFGRGTGFFVTEDGYIFTNRHVVETCVKGYLDYDYMDETGAVKAGFATYSEELINDKNFKNAVAVGYTIPKVQVFYGSGENDYQIFTAEVIAMGVGAFDGALLKIVGDENSNPGDFKFSTVPIGNSDNVQQGEQLCVFGYPQQVRGSLDVMLRDMSTLSLGVMSGHDYVFNSDYGYIKTDAEIHPGNSGGPVFNEENKVIGIATAKGVDTGIGLVGGVNGMYYISAIDNNAHRQLIANGLRLPKKFSSINSIVGTKQPIKTLEEINSLKGISPKFDTNLYNIPSVTDYYKNTRVFFSNISVADNDNQIPNESKSYKLFNIDRQTGGKIWIYVDNSPLSLYTEQITVSIDKRNAEGTYEEFKDLAFNVNSAFDYTYFSHDFYEIGTFRVSVYSKENKYINSAELELIYR